MSVQQLMHVKSRCEKEKSVLITQMPFQIGTSHNLGNVRCNILEPKNGKPRKMKSDHS